MADPKDNEGGKGAGKDSQGKGAGKGAGKEGGRPNSVAGNPADPSAISAAAGNGERRELPARADMDGGRRPREITDDDIASLDEQLPDDALERLLERRAARSGGVVAGGKIRRPTGKYVVIHPITYTDKEGKPGQRAKAGEVVELSEADAKLFTSGQHPSVEAEYK